MKYVLEGLVKKAKSFGDERRILWPDPEDITGIKGYRQHGSFKVNIAEGILGNHYHPSSQVTHMLSGKGKFRIINLNDLEERGEYCVEEGFYIEIPGNFGHAAIMESGTIFQDFGFGKFNPKNVIPCESDVINLLSDEEYFRNYRYPPL